jgi:tRNA A37 methylthiotransferase MiaB
LKLGDDVPEEVKAERLARLFERVDAIQQRHLQSLLGTRTRVLFEGASKSGPSDHDGGAAAAERRPVFMTHAQRRLPVVNA